MKTKLIICLSLLFLIQPAFAQNYSTDNKKAIKYYEKAQEEFKINRNFEEGLALLEKALEKDPEFTEAHTLLAGNYYMLGKKEEAVKHYQKVFELGKDEPRYSSVIYDLGKIYFEDGQYKKAQEAFEAVEYTSEGKFPRNQYYLHSAKFAMEAVKNAYDFEPKELPKSINKFKFQSHPQLTADGEQMIFSVRAGMGLQFDEQIAIVTKKDTTWGIPRNISDSINTQRNEGFASITADGKTIVFTSCDRPDGIGRCDLYISKKTGDHWGQAKNMGETVNSPSWESGPAITADGSKIYFSSDRKGGFGEKDLWVTEKNDEENWKTPVNLGNTVNTKYSEVTPFIHADGHTLFFASDGHPGLGGYDIFYSKNLNGTWTRPFNLGYPLNTEHNEGSLFISPDNGKGYFEKYVSMGRDSYSLLYEVELPMALKVATPSIYAKGFVKDASTKEPLAASIELVDLETEKTIQHVFSDRINGSYLIVLSEAGNYGLFAEKEGYLFFSKNFDFNRKKFDVQELNVFLTPVEEGQTIVLNNVFFESGSADLLNESQTELKMVAYLMKENPELRIRIEGHTDNTGDEQSNLKLSELRSRSVFKFLVKDGIEPSRMNFKGFGESQPIAINETEEGKAKNRRIEIKIIE